MSRPTVKFVSAMSACFIAGIHLATASDSSANAADHCLTAPNGEPTDGGHWYYRLERTTRRHCWYVKGEKEKPAPTASQDPSPLDDAVSPQKSASASVTDAHAELRLPQTRVEQNTGVGAMQAPQATASSSRASTDDVFTQNPAVASRWPQPSGVASSTNPLPATGFLVADDRSTPNAVPQPPVDAPSATTVSPAIHATADASSGKPSSRIPKLLVVMFGALSVAGVVASAFIRTGSKRAGRRKRPTEPYPVWEPAPSAYRKPVEPRSGFAATTADDPSRRIEEMLAQLSRNPHR